jgi:hypothetical protein
MAEGSLEHMESLLVGLVPGMAHAAEQAPATSDVTLELLKLG